MQDLAHAPPAHAARTRTRRHVCDENVCICCKTKSSRSVLPSSHLARSSTASLPVCLLSRCEQHCAAGHGMREAHVRTQVLTIVSPDHHMRGELRGSVVASSRRLSLAHMAANVSPRLQVGGSGGDPRTALLRSNRQARQHKRRAPRASAYRPRRSNAALDAPGTALTAGSIGRGHPTRTRQPAERTGSTGVAGGPAWTRSAAEAERPAAP